LLLVIFDAIQELVVGMRQALVPEPVDPEEALRAFRQIVQHIQAGESQPAAQVIQRHLGEISQRLEAALARAEVTADRPADAREARL
jgi:DNA-binding FadR family transcriptional regulator